MNYLFYLINLLFLLLSYSKDITLLKLEEYGVSSTMRKAIQGMTSSGLKKDVIQKNLQGHYPNKKLHELNDIIVLSNIVDGKNLPRDKDNKKEMNRKIKNLQQKMNKNK